MTDDTLTQRLDALERKLEALHDREQIADVLTRYSRAIDWLDEGVLDSVFYDDAEIDYGFFKGTGKDFKPLLIKMEQNVGRRWHVTTQPLIDVQGDQAFVDSYNLTMTASEQAPTADAPLTLYIGFYKDRFLKRNGRWGIAARKHLKIINFVASEQPPGTTSILNEIGAAAMGHPDYRRLQELFSLGEVSSE